MTKRYFTDALKQRFSAWLLFGFRKWGLMIVRLEPRVMAWPEDVVPFHFGDVPCDKAIGPCACGSVHTLAGWKSLRETESSLTAQLWYVRLINRIEENDIVWNRQAAYA